MSEWSWILALAAGFAAAWIIQALRRIARAPSDAERAAQEAARAAQEAERAAAAQEQARLTERCRKGDEDLQQARADLAALRDENGSLARRLAAADQRNLSLEERLAEQKRELEELQKKLAAEFENLAQRVLEATSQKFVTQNKESLDKLLLPLSEKIVTFRDRVEKIHEQGLKDQASLREHLKAQGELNQRMSDEARNLTNALKGQSKTQGNWGELILETVLEKSGLVAGQEYDVQVSLQSEDGRRLQPDVLIRLPEGKSLVIDAKVSLVAYERCVNADDDAQRALSLREHIQSLKTHVADLGKKRYDALYSIQSPDFVLLFVPIESAFSLAMQNDDTLFDQAFRQNVAIVTPTTLLATLRTVANIWRQEKQTRNALEIARRGGALYDKFVGFVEDLQKVGQHIEKSRSVYDDAMSKLRGGRGNLVAQVESLKLLGAKARKNLPIDELEKADDGLALEEG